MSCEIKYCGAQRKMTREAIILKPIKDLLKLLKEADLLDYTRVHVMAVLNGGRRTKNKGMRGFADLEVVAMGRIGYIEVKVPGEQLSEAQEEFKKTRTRHGALWCTAFSLADAVEFLTDKMKIDVTLLG